MSLEPVTAGIDLITAIVSRVWPDKTEQEKAILAAALASDANLTSLLLGQLKVNEAEASNSNLFVAGWRPAIGWVCALAFTWQFVALPILLFIGTVFGHTILAPAIDTVSMVSILTGMLGLGTLRTAEKLSGRV